jgi:hypothetical protein
MRTIGRISARRQGTKAHIFFFLTETMEGAVLKDRLPPDQADLEAAEKMVARF